MIISVWENIAAAVFDVGRLEQSPRDQTFGYLTCWRVYLSTSTNPAAFPSPDSAI